MVGPHPAALAAIEVAEEIEPPAPIPTRTESGDGFEDQVRMYLREIGTVPLLTWDGEKRLARAMEAGTYLQAVMRRNAEADGPPSVLALYRDLYLRLRGLYRFVLADCARRQPRRRRWDALRRSARLADIDPEHLRRVLQLAEASLEETERSLVAGLDDLPHPAGRRAALVRRPRHRRRAARPGVLRGRFSGLRRPGRARRRAGARSSTSRIERGAI